MGGQLVVYCVGERDGIRANVFEMISDRVVVVVRAGEERFLSFSTDTRDTKRLE